MWSQLPTRFLLFYVFALTGDSVWSASIDPGLRQAILSPEGRRRLCQSWVNQDDTYQSLSVSSSYMKIICRNYVRQDDITSKEPTYPTTIATTLLQGRSHEADKPFSESSDNTWSSNDRVFGANDENPGLAPHHKRGAPRILHTTTQDPAYTSYYFPDHHDYGSYNQRSALTAYNNRLLSLYYKQFRPDQTEVTTTPFPYLQPVAVPDQRRINPWRSPYGRPNRFKPYGHHSWKEATTTEHPVVTTTEPPVPTTTEPPVSTTTEPPVIVISERVASDTDWAGYPIYDDYVYFPGPVYTDYDDAGPSIVPPADTTDSNTTPVVTTYATPQLTTAHSRPQGSSTTQKNIYGDMHYIGSWRSTGRGSDKTRSTPRLTEVTREYTKQMSSTEASSISTRKAPGEVEMTSGSTYTPKGIPVTTQSVGSTGTVASTTEPQEQYKTTEPLRITAGTRVSPTVPKPDSFLNYATDTPSEEPLPSVVTMGWTTPKQYIQEKTSTATTPATSHAPTRSTVPISKYVYTTSESSMKPSVTAESPKYLSTTQASLSSQVQTTPQSLRTTQHVGLSGGYMSSTKSPSYTRESPESYAATPATEASQQMVTTEEATTPGDRQMDLPSSLPVTTESPRTLITQYPYPKNEIPQATTTEQQKLPTYAPYTVSPKTTTRYEPPATATYAITSPSTQRVKPTSSELPTTTVTEDSVMEKAWPRPFIFFNEYDDDLVTDVPSTTPTPVTASSYTIHYPELSPPQPRAQSTMDKNIYPPAPFFFPQSPNPVSDVAYVVYYPYGYMISPINGSYQFHPVHFYIGGYRKEIIRA